MTMEPPQQPDLTLKELRELLRSRHRVLRFDGRQVDLQRIDDPTSRLSRTVDAEALKYLHKLKAVGEMFFFDP